MIKISVVSYNNVAPASPLSAVFGRDGKTLGRSEENHLVLADPKHFVSRVQALIKSDGVRRTITNLSQANPIWLNGLEIDAEREYELQSGDQIQIGLYLLRADAHLSLMKENVNMTNQPANDPINSALGANRLPAEPDARQAAIAQSALAQLHLELAAANAAPSAPNAAAHPAPVADSGEADAVPETVEASADVQALTHAFLKGASLPAGALTAGLTTEVMETVGKLLATAVQGTIDLNAARALVKREANADVTKVVVRNNNPVKFFQDSKVVLTQMLRKKMPGFMGATEAMEDVYQDLHAHQHGVVSGMRGNMNEVLHLFNPDALERKVQQSGFVASLLPANRKAKLWDAYVARFQKIDEAAQDEFQSLFGKAFLQAYEKKVEQVKKQNG
ncbi:type VI secretion system-associated FHA domain protein TagH [Paraherbaspirillum soli]|uniref:Type VI secretion system-associated FHA domain protein TagH n=1 Tax=Paraherbaspirillum soli TaxID=631222 RepID=A0ABW0M8N4_9BURK